MRKYLRIAVTALSLTACVLLIALWVRSYYWWDEIHGPIPNSYGINITSVIGRMVCNVFIVRPGNTIEWETLSSSGTEANDFHWLEFPGPLGGFDVMIDSDGAGIVIPHWFLVFMFAAIAAAPWIRWSNRFSLRTLLIAMTLIAVGLGAVIYLAR